MEVAEIAAEIGGEAVASADSVWDVFVGYIVMVFKAKEVNKGEELFDEVGEGHVGVVVSEGAPKLCRRETLLAPDNVKP